MASVLAASSPETLSTALRGVDIFAIAGQFETKGQQDAGTLALTGAFILVSQMVMHELLARGTGKATGLNSSEVCSWTEVETRYSHELSGTDSDQLFALPVANILEALGDDLLLRRSLQGAQQLLCHLPECDALGTLYNQLVPARLRKQVGAFYTNGAAAQLLARLAISNAAARVIDPACGSGALLLAAYSRLKVLRGGSQSAATHTRRLLSQLTGIDVMPFPACLAALNLLLQQPKGRPSKLRIGVADSTGLDPESTVLDWQGRRRFRVDGHDVVLMNPPFTRGHSLSKGDKRRLESKFSAYQTYLGGLAGLHGYFLLLAHKLLREGGHLGTVLPASTFGTRSNLGLTAFLLGNFTIDFVILCRQRSAFSEQTNLREILLLARKQPPSDRHQVTFAAINKSPEHWSAGDIEAFQMTISKDHSPSTSGLTLSADLWTRRVPQASLLRGPRAFYQNLLQTNSSLVEVHQMAQHLLSRREVQPFSAVLQHLGAPCFVNPRGSFAAGFKALSFLPSAEACLKSNDVWFIAERRAGAIQVKNRFTNRCVNLRLADTIPCFRRLTGLATINSSSAIGRTLSQDITPAAEELLTDTYRQGEAAGYLEDLRAHWSTHVARMRTHLVMTYKADLGAPGTHLLAAVSDTAAYPAGDAWIFPRLSLEQARVLSLWMNSTFFLVDLLVNRTEQRGSWMRFDKPVLDQLLLLDPSLLSGTQCEQLLKLYTEVQLTALPPILSQLEQKDRTRIDERILLILGVRREDAVALAAKAASAARETISELVAMMRGD